jgi:hypothetical protein
MTRSYVAIDDSVHHLLREITRRTLLVASVDREGDCTVAYEVDEKALPESYYSLAMLHSLGGVPHDCLAGIQWFAAPVERTGIAAQVNFFDAARLDRRCSRDLRLRPTKNGPTLLSGELLCFGTGMLRALNDDVHEPVHRHIWTQFGRISSRHEVVYATMRALHRNSIQPQTEIGKESFESTNMIYGDAHGELLQIWDRRADTELLERLAQSLDRFRHRAEVAAHFHAPLNVPGMMQLHLQRQGVWRVPPPSARALLRRVEFILERTTVDNKARTIFNLEQRESVRHVRRGTSKNDRWNTDHSGYDGWLQR